MHLSRTVPLVSVCIAAPFLCGLGWWSRTFVIHKGAGTCCTQMPLNPWIMTQYVYFQTNQSNLKQRTWCIELQTCFQATRLQTSKLLYQKTLLLRPSSWFKYNFHFNFYKQHLWHWQVTLSVFINHFLLFRFSPFNFLLVATDWFKPPLQRDHNPQIRTKGFAWQAPVTLLAKCLGPAGPASFFCPITTL